MLKNGNHIKEHYLKPIWSDKPGSCQDGTQGQLHSPYASKVVFAQEGPCLRFAIGIGQFCMVILVWLQIQQELT
jgi:hypothetical protein